MIVLQLLRFEVICFLLRAHSQSHTQQISRNLVLLAQYFAHTTNTTLHTQPCTTMHNHAHYFAHLTMCTLHTINSTRMNNYILWCLTKYKEWEQGNGGDDNLFDHLKRQEIKMEEIWRRDKRRELEKRREAEFTKILLLQATQKRLLLALASSPDEELFLHFEMWFSDFKCFAMVSTICKIEIKLFPM